MASVTELVIKLQGQDAVSGVLKGVKESAGGLGKTLGETQKSAAGFGSAMQVAVGIGLAQAPQALGNIIGGFTGAASAGAALELQTKKASVVFGEQIGVVKTWATENAHAMGLTTTEATTAAAGFADLLIPMGFTREAAAKMSTDVVGLSGALSEWSGGTRSAAEVSDILAKAMLGERDALKGLGISISEEEVQTQLLKNGTAELTGEQLAQAKATATQQLIMAKSVDAQNAYAEGADSAARQTAELKAKQKELGEQMAQKSLPIMNSLTGAFMKLPAPLQAGIFGLKGVAGALGPMSPALMGLVPGLGAVIAATWAHVTALTAQAAAMIAANAPIVAVVAGIAAVAAGVYLLITHWDDITSAFKRLPEMLSEAWGWVTGFFTETVPTWIKDNWPQILIGVFTGIPGLVLFHFRDKLWEIAQTDVLPFFTSTIPDWVRDNWPQLLIATFTGVPGLVLFHFKDALWTVFQSDVQPLFTSTIPTWFTDNWVPIVVGVLTGGAGTMIYAFRDEIAAKATEIAGNLLSAGGEMGNALMGGFVNGVKGLATGIGEIFTGTIDVAKEVANAIIKAINEAIAKINEVIPNEIGFSIMGKGFNFNLPDNPVPTIPLLARGGIVTRPTLALLAERGYPEAVIPLDRGQRGLAPGPVYNYNYTINFDGPFLGDMMARQKFADWMAQQGFLRREEIR